MVKSLVERQVHYSKGFQTMPNRAPCSIPHFQFFNFSSSLVRLDKFKMVLHVFWCEDFPDEDKTS